MGNCCAGSRDSKPLGDSHKETDHTEANTGGHSDSVDQHPKKITTERKFLYAIEPKVYISIVKGNLTDHYKIEDTIYEGSKSRVVKIRSLKTSIEYVLKLIQKSAVVIDPKHRLFEEAAILANLDHPNISSLMEIFEDEMNYYEVVEYASGGEAFAKVKENPQGLEEALAADYMRQLLSAVAYLHLKGVTHRKISLENVILGSGPATYSNLKLVGFGSACPFTAEKLTEAVEPNFYTAPEVVNKSYNERCDEWSCGAVCYALLSGRIAFSGGNKKDLIKNLKSGKYTMDGERWAKISPEAKDFVKKLMTVDPASRMTAAQALQHEWIKKNASELVIKNDLIKNLREFKSANTFQLGVMHFIAMRVLSHFTKSDLHETFQKLDEDGDGRITKEDLERVFKLAFGGEKDYKEDVERVFAQIDTNKSGEIDYSEYILAALPADVLLSEDNIKRAFSMFDADDDKHISKEELGEKFPGLASIDKAIDKLFSSVDHNSDNKISLKEFTAMLLEKEQSH